MGRWSMSTAVQDTHAYFTNTTLETPKEEIVFEAFPKLSRLSTGIIITEKIDGTNAAVGVTKDGQVYAQSRKKLIYPGKQTDNAGFAGWVEEHADELRDGLGVGLHFGEWWGAAIQRKYGLTDKRFSLFNTGRWSDPNVRPSCCHCVPVLAQWGECDTNFIKGILKGLLENGSVAAPGFKDPEGIIIFLKTANKMFKMTADDKHKGGS